MRTIVHLSDLHFGRVDPAIPPALLAAVAEAHPNLVVVSGDFTQRAKVREFKQAARFLAALPGPLLLVPGNHDVPLYDVLRRWLSPLGRYRRFITDDLAPFYADAEIAVLGINTARALTFKNGRINRHQVAAAVQRLATYPPDITRIVVTHHPPGDEGLGRAAMAMAELIRSNVDMVLSGHLHISHVAPTTDRFPGRAALLVQAGTATSTRQRAELNAFNVIQIARPEATVITMVWNPATSRFAPAATERFSATPTGWSPLPP